MRGLVVALSGCLLAVGMLVGAGPAQAAVPGYDSSFFGESAFLTMTFGGSGQFAAIFTNTGTTAWQRNTVSQVNLGICLADKVTCSAPSPNAAWNDGSWLSSLAYATASTDLVAPGQNAFFTYNVRAPSTASAGSYRFNGELVLASTLQVLRPQGYYQDVTLTGASTDVTPPTAVVFASGYPAQSGLSIVTKGTAYDIGGGIASVSVKVQKTDVGVLTDVTSYSSATADDGFFSSPIELFTQTTGPLTINAGQPVRVVVKVTDTGGNTNTFIAALAANSGNWSTAPQGINDTTLPTITTTSCVDPLTGSVANGCGVNTSATTPSSGNTVVFSAFASDDVGVTAAEYAVSRSGTGDTVIGWSPCVAADGAFGGKLETVACTVTFPTGATPAGGTSFVILLRAIDAAGNRSTPADPTTGVSAGSQFCTFFQSQYATGGGGASTTGNCVWIYDNSRPYVTQTERGAGTIAPNMPVDQNSLMVLAFSESMRSISTTSPQSITVTDGTGIRTLTSGVNATFSRCFAGVTISTPGYCASTNSSTAGMGMTWQIVPTANVGLFYPLTLTAITNFKDYAGNTVDLSRGDQVID